MFAVSLFHSFLDVFTLVANPILSGFSHLLPQKAIDIVILCDFIRIGILCFLQGSSLATEVKEDIIGNPWLLFLPLTTEYLLSSVTDCLIKVSGEVIDVIVQEA
jgi:hypothetical protein